jgi:hypothetical protein
MYIYNITVQVGHAIAPGWLKWMREVHIPGVMATGMFTHHRIVKLLEVEESEGLTYAVQYFCTSLDAYRQYISQYAPALREEVNKQWGDQLISFRTLMEVIN